MNPIEQMLMAARGHQGLPMQIGGQPDGMSGGMPGGMPGDPSQMGAPPASMGGGLPAGPPPFAPPPPGGSEGSSDREVADTAAQHLLAATHQATDPALKASLANALAALHKFIMMDEKEHHQAMSGKFSPRMMARQAQ